MGNSELPGEPNPDKYLVPGLERGLRLLSEFSRGDKTMSAPELAKRLDVPRSTIFRLLATLERMNFIERTEGGRDYKLGMAVLRLGFEYLASLELTELGRPLLERLRDEINYPCNLVVRDGRFIVYVAKAVTPMTFVSSVNVGTRLPAHATVLGRILLENLSLAELRNLFPEENLEVFSDSTPKNVVDLFNLVVADRSRGYVLEEGFFETRISTVAAPVRDQSGRVIAALGATIPSPHIEAGQLNAIVQRVCGTANELSLLLGCPPREMLGKVINLMG